MLITHLFSQNNKVLALSSNAIFPKNPTYRRLSLLGSRKYLLIAESKLNRDQQVGNMSVLTASVDGFSPRQARRRRQRNLFFFANDFQKARLSFPPFCWRHAHDERPRVQSGASLQATGDRHDCVRTGQIGDGP
jgi:hypothetical protein